MKSLLTLLAFLLTCTFSAQAQYPGWMEHFEAPFTGYQSRFIVIDTVGTGNLWQIGKPQKAAFDSAYSYPNAIVTDTVNTYPPNDTAQFIVKVVGYYAGNTQPILDWYALEDFSFRFKLDIDSGEVAKVEVSADTGTHWVDIMTEDTTYDITWGPGKPDLSGKDTNWQYFYADVVSWSLNSGYPHFLADKSKQVDTILVRFTFISDGNETNKDGWIIDNFQVHNFWSGIRDIANDNLISIYPNPAKDAIYIRSNYSYKADAIVTIFDLSGRVVVPKQSVSEDGVLPVSLPDGNYRLIYDTGSELSVKQLVIMK